MSKNSFFFNKKSNPLAAVINKRNVSPNLTSRTNTQKGDNSMTDVDNSKLYTFCSSENKNQKK